MNTFKTRFLSVIGVLVLIISSSCSNSQKAYVTIDLGMPVHSVSVGPVSPFTKIVSRINDYIAVPLYAAPGEINKAYIAVFEGEAIKENMLTAELFYFETPINPRYPSSIVLEVPAGDNRTFVVYGTGISANTLENVILNAGISSGIDLKAGEEKSLIIDANITNAAYSSMVPTGPPNTVIVNVYAPLPEQYYQVEVMKTSIDPFTSVYDTYDYSQKDFTITLSYQPFTSRARGYSPVFNLPMDWKPLPAY